MKTNHPSKKSNKDIKKPTNVEQAVVTSEFLGEYLNVHTFKMHPATLRFVEHEAQRLKEWAELETSLRLADFIDGEGYNPETFYGWCKKSPLLHAVHQYALRRIGARRENGALSKQMDVPTVHRTLGYYDSVWKSEVIAAARLKEEVAPSNETKVVVIERFPSMDSLRTPEEVAQANLKLTRDSRSIGSPYARNAKSAREVREPKDEE